LTNQSPAPFEGSKPSAQLLIFLGLTGIAFFLLGILSIVLQNAGIINLYLIQEPANYVDSAVVTDARNYQLVSDIVMFVVPVVTFAFLASRNRLHYLQMDKTGKLSVMIMGALVLVAGIPLINFLAELNERIPLPTNLQTLEQMADDLETALLSHATIHDLVLNLFVMAFAAAVIEELFFRGVLQKIMITVTKNTHVGIWVSAIIFSAIHLQFSGFLPRMLMGVYLGYLLIWSGSLWVTMLAHFMNNAVAVLFSYFEARKMISDTVEKIGSQGSEYGYVIISTSLVILLMVGIYKVSHKKTDKVLP
jgi:membrane protease YdiL (CAAX protease family)